MKFEDLKRKANDVFRGQVERMDFVCKDALYGTLHDFVMMNEEERSLLREYAKSVAPATEAQARNDFLAATAARDDSLRGRFMQLLLKARDEGLKRIDRWDVRQAAKLIELFPDAAPARYRDVELVCHCDTPSGEWVIEVAEPCVKRASMKR